MHQIDGIILSVDNCILKSVAFSVFVFSIVLFCIYICCWVLPLLINQTLSKLMPQFPLQLLVNYWEDVLVKL